MFPSFTLRLLYRLVVLLTILSTFVLAYLHLYDTIDTQIDTTAASEIPATTRIARHIWNDGTVHFEDVATFDSPDKADNIYRSSIKIDTFGEVYVSTDGADIAIGDSGHAYSQPAPLWTAASGESRLFSTMPRDRRLVLKQSDDGGHTFHADRQIVGGFENGRSAVQGNLIIAGSRTGSRLYNVFLTPARNEIQLADCVDSCRRFAVRQVFISDGDRTFDHPYPVVAADQAGGIHVAFSDGQDVYLISSPDGGETWKEPVRVSDRMVPVPEPARAPVVTAGDSGRVGVVWQQGSRLLASYTSDAFSSDPSFHSTLVSAQVSPAIAAAAAVDPSGMMWIAYRAGNRLVVTSQVSGSSLTNKAVWSAFGKFQGDDTARRLSINIRQDLTGQLSFVDSDLHLSVRGNRFKISGPIDGELSISGSGMLQNGTGVAFTLLVPETAGDSNEISISTSNGYFASGKLLRPKNLAAYLHVVAQGGNILNIPH